MLGGTALTISSNVTITGAGARLLAISGNNASRVFNVDDGNGSTNATVAISGLSITDGAAVQGAGIFNAETLTVTAGSIVDSESTGNGAGLFNDITGNLTVQDSTIRNNIAAGSGGGISNFKGQLTVLNSTISGNTAFSGGGLFEFYGTVNLKSVTITGNTTTTGSGGGLLIGADGVVMHNTIVAGNTAENGGNDIFDELGSANGGLSASSSHNLIGDPIGFDALSNGVNGNIIGNGGNVIDVATILNTTIANNGGPTDTHALTAFSRAIDAGDSVSGAAAGDFDQRGEGFDRVEYGVIDIGAFEFLATPTLTATIDGSGNLTVTESDKEGIDHRLTVSSFNNGEEFLRINGGNESFDEAILTALPGAELSNRNRTLTIALSLLTGTSITIDAGLGDDRITFDDTHIDDFNITATAESITVQTVTADTLRAKSVTLNADEVRILANIIADSGNGTVTIQPQTDGQLIDLGGADATGTLGLTDAELDFIYAATLVIGNSDAGAITVSSDIDLTDEPSVATLHLNTAAGVTSTDGGLKVGGLAINADGAVTLNDADTAVSTVAITTSGAITINQSGALTVSSVGSQSGIDNSSGTGNVSLTSSAGGITVANAGLKSSGNVTISAAGNVSTSGVGISNTGGTGSVEVTTTVGTLTIDGSGIQSKGAVTVSAPGLVSLNGSGINNSSGTGNVSF